MRHIYNVLAFGPLIWLFYVSSFYLSGYWVLGHIPKYGIDPDPIALGINENRTIGMFFLIVFLISFFLWPILFFTDLFIKRNRFKIDKIPTLTFFISTIIILVSRFVLDSFFDWYFD